MLPTLATNNNNNMQQQQQQQQQETHHQIIMQPKAVKQTKVRRTRQPRNPQLSVARRNERERNRVKMVNNGFALLREHLPAEDLQANAGEQSGSDTPTPDAKSAASGQHSKAKKFSKVETLRAAIQRIRMLEELIRSTEPGFESINLTSSSAHNLMATSLDGYGDDDDLDDEQEGMPLSCGGSSQNSNSNSNQVPTPTPTTIIKDISFNQQQQQQQTLYTSHHLGLNSSQTTHQEQFIKLEPQTIVHNLPSPQDSQTSSNSQTSGCSININTHHQYPHQATQVHHHPNPHHQMDQPMPNHHQSHLVLLSPISQQQQEPSHTHLWIQQHQSSFMEQQQQQHQYEQQQMDNFSNNWYSQQQQQQQGNWFIQTTETPEQINSLQPIQPNDINLQQQQQQQQQVDSAAWPYASSSPSTTVQTTASASPQQLTQMPAAFGHHQHHQISLYSQ